jgi:hypothetical protein
MALASIYMLGRQAHPRMARKPSRRDLRRAESAPQLSTLWEPDRGEDESSSTPPWLHSGSSTASAATDGLSDGLHSYDGLAIDGSSLPTGWEPLLAHISQGHSTCENKQLVAAALDSFRQEDAQQLRTGRLDEHYLLKGLLASGSHFEVYEGVELGGERLKNYSVKFISWRGASYMRQQQASNNGKGKLDPMQAFYLISSFVDEVFATPQHLILCMRWGCHEVDATHQLSTLILDAFDLLRELLPPEQRYGRRLRIGKADLQRLLLRSMALDTFMQDHLLLEWCSERVCVDAACFAA